MTRLFVLDGQPLFRDALCAVLTEACGEGAVCAFDAEGALDDLNKGAFDVALINAETLKRIDIGGAVRAAGEAPVIITSASLDDEIARQALGAGAHGYIVKTMRGQAIVGAVALVLNGGACYPTQALPLMAADRAATRSAHSLSRRELEILHRIEQGGSNKLIARDLGLSLATVKFHVQSLLRTTGARNRVEAIINARRMGLLSVAR